MKARAGREIETERITEVVKRKKFFELMFFC